MSRIALTADAIRGAGRGIACILGEAGATVYCTGRSTCGRRSPIDRPETIEETPELVSAQGGMASGCSSTTEIQSRSGRSSSA